MQIVFNDITVLRCIVSKWGWCTVKTPANAGFYYLEGGIYDIGKLTKGFTADQKPLPPNAGQGRVKGVPNKNTRLLKEAIIKAAELAGSKYGKEGLISYLEQQAIKCPAAYLALLGKILPLQVTGEDGGGIKIIGRVEIAPLTMNDDKTD